MRIAGEVRESYISCGENADSSSVNYLREEHVVAKDYSCELHVDIPDSDFDQDSSAEKNIWMEVSHNSDTEKNNDLKVDQSSTPEINVDQSSTPEINVDQSSSPQIVDHSSRDEVLKNPDLDVEQTAKRDCPRGESDDLEGEFKVVKKVGPTTEEVQRPTNPEDQEPVPLCDVQKIGEKLMNEKVFLGLLSQKTSERNKYSTATSKNQNFRTGDAIRFYNNRDVGSLFPKKVESARMEPGRDHRHIPDQGAPYGAKVSFDGAQSRRNYPKRMKAVRCGENGEGVRIVRRLAPITRDDDNLLDVEMRDSGFEVEQDFEQDESNQDVSVEDDSDLQEDKEKDNDTRYLKGVEWGSDLIQRYIYIDGEEGEYAWSKDEETDSEQLPEYEEYSEYSESGVKAESVEGSSLDGELDQYDVIMPDEIAEIPMESAKSSKDSLSLFGDHFVPVPRSSSFINFLAALYAGGSRSYSSAFLALTAPQSHADLRRSAAHTHAIKRTYQVLRGAGLAAVQLEVCLLDRWLLQHYVLCLYSHDCDDRKGVALSSFPLHVLGDSKSGDWVIFPKEDPDSDVNLLQALKEVRDGLENIRKLGVPGCGLPGRPTLEAVLLEGEGSSETFNHIGNLSSGESLRILHVFQPIFCTIWFKFDEEDLELQKKVLSLELLQKATLVLMELCFTATKEKRFGTALLLAQLQLRCTLCTNTILESDLLNHLHVYTHTVTNWQLANCYYHLWQSRDRGDYSKQYTGQLECGMKEFVDGLREFSEDLIPAAKVYPVEHLPHATLPDEAVEAFQRASLPPTWAGSAYRHGHMAAVMLLRRSKEWIGEELAGV